MQILIKISLILLCSLSIQIETSQAAVVGQVDDFQDGTLQNWTSGGRNPNPPVLINDGGPNGVGDDYMQATATGSGAGGKLVLINTTQWLGDYDAAGITGVNLDINNFSTNTLNMRLLDTNGPFSLPVTVSAQSGWVNITIPVPANFNPTGQLRLIHGVADIPGSGVAPNVNAIVGFDNIQAIPEPASMSLLALGVLGMIRRKKVCR